MSDLDITPKGGIAVFPLRCHLIADFPEMLLSCGFWTSLSRLTLSRVQ